MPFYTEINRITVVGFVGGRIDQKLTFRASDFLNCDSGNSPSRPDTLVLVSVTACFSLKETIC